MSATGMGSSAPRSVIESCVVSAATAWGFYLMARFVNHRQGSLGAWFIMGGQGAVVDTG